MPNALPARRRNDPAPARDSGNRRVGSMDHLLLEREGNELAAIPLDPAA